MTPGPGRTVEVASAGASQAQRRDGQRIRRLTGETTRSRSLTGVTGPHGKHRDLGRLGASSRSGEAAHGGHRLALHATVDAGVAEDVRAASRLIQRVRQGENAEPPSSGAGRINLPMDAPYLGRQRRPVERDSRL
jgi:hypothetical protein